MDRPKQEANRESAFALVAYLATAALLMVFSVFPEGRVWGFNLLAFFPTIVRVMAIPVIVLVPIALHLARRFLTEPKSENNVKDAQGPIQISIFVGLMTAMFYFFRASNQFEGDGYAAIANLASAHPLLKYRNLGAVLAESGLYHLLGRGGEHTAWLAYQLISYLSGAGFLILSILVSRALFERTRERVLMILGMAVGGYALLFFGYAENYPLFVVSIVFYLYAGILIVKGRAGWWLILVANALAVFLHIFGLMLLPATVFILLRSPRMGKWIGSQSIFAKTSLSLIVVAASASCFFYLFYTNYFFRFAFLPILSDRFTVNGYTIFSSKHLVDLLNLLFIMCPGILVLIVSSGAKASKRLWRDATIKFLLVATASTALTVVIFDPKLGMARDWDLFAFAGVPLNLLLWTIALSPKEQNRNRYFAVILAIFLGVFFLSARVAIKKNDRVAIKRVYSFIPLDPVRNNKNEFVVSRYYFDTGDSAQGYKVDSVWERGNRDIILAAYGRALRDSGRVNEAIAAFRQAIAYNPFERLAYNELGHTFGNLGQLDSAEYYLRVAQGLRPDDPDILSNLGWIASLRGDKKTAERLWLKSMDLDSHLLAPQMLLLRQYKHDGELVKYQKLLPLVAENNNAPSEVLVEASIFYYREEDFADARRLWARAMANGMDSTEYRDILSSHPKLHENGTKGE